MKERRNAASEVSKQADVEYADNKDLDLIIRALTNPSFDDRPANRIAIKAAFKIDGYLREDVFYKEENEKVIGSTASGMLKQYEDLCDLYGDFYSLKREAEQLAKTLR